MNSESQIDGKNRFENCSVLVQNGKKNILFCAYVHTVPHKTGKTQISENAAKKWKKSKTKVDVVGNALDICKHMMCTNNSRF